MKRAALFFALLLAGCGKAPVPAPVEAIAPAEQTAVIVEKPEPVVNRPAEHVVARGEILIDIALKYGLEYREMARWNNLRDPDLLQVGQRLRLSAPENEPVAAAVRRAPKSRLVKTSPAPKRAVTPAKPAAAPAAAEETPAAAANDAPLKTAPLAQTYAYSPAQLKKLQREWQAQNGAAPAPAPAPAAPAAAGETAAAANAPAAVRRRFGVDWSWPTDAKVGESFNEIRKGVNFFGAAQAPVFASAAGKVVYVGSGVKSYGRLVILKHDNDYLTAYAHNAEILVKEGEQVRRGAKIAVFGSTGTDKIMLHFEVRKAGKPFDPMQVLPKRPR